MKSICIFPSNKEKLDYSTSCQQSLTLSGCDLLAVASVFAAQKTEVSHIGPCITVWKIGKHVKKILSKIYSIISTYKQILFIISMYLSILQKVI